ncbi:RNase H domain-containing protein [Hirsutella rhossiliensis]
MTCPRWNKPAKEGPSRIRHLIRRMDKSLNTAMRAILPVWKTTPLSARHREAGIPPVSHLLQACRTRFAARLKSSTKRTRLRCARPDLLAQSAANFGEWLQSVAPRTAIVYSDGSLSPEEPRGTAMRYIRMDSPSSAVTAVLGLLRSLMPRREAPRGLRAALSLPAADQIVVCLDNLAVATCLQGMPSDSSQKEFLEFQALAAEHGATEIRWIPGHTNIPDALPTLAYLRKVARQRPKDAFKAWWEVSAPQQYRVLDLDATTGCPPELTIPRPLLHHLLAARTHHGTSLITTKEPKHLFYCRKIAPRHRMRLAPSPSAAVNRAIGRDFDQFVKVAKASSFFGTICPRH